MKLFILVFITYIGFVNSYNLNYVPGVSGFIELVDFDKDGNIYAVSYATNIAGEKDHTFFKLNSERELLSTVSFPSGITLVSEMHVTERQDVYFFLYIPENNGNNDTFAVLRAGSDTLEIVDHVSHEFFFLDPYDNLYYGKEEFGLRILRPGANTSIPIKNLEDFFVFRPETVAVDKEGNVYFGVDGRHISNGSVALLTKEELQNEIPEARLVKIKDKIEEQILDIVIDESNGIWIITAMISYKGYIKKLFPNGTYEIVKTDPTHPNLDVTAAKDRIWVVASHGGQVNSPSIYYITLDNKVVDIPELQNLTQQRYFSSKSLADSDGRVYFKANDVFTTALGSMIIINPGETKAIPVRFNPNNPDLVIDNIFMDINEDVWVLSSIKVVDNIYVIKKGETTANVIQNSGDICDGVYSNPVTKDIFLGCYRGLIIAVNES